MFNRFAMMMCSSFLFTFVFSGAYAGNVMKDTTIGGLRIELHVMAAEPFFSKEDAASLEVTEGMLIMGGAKPVDIDDESHPNRHLVVHIFDAKSGKAITNAKVKMSFHNLADSTGISIKVPVVVMQMAGKGVQSTHYGNNVVMPDGSYSVAVVVKGKKVSFNVDLANSTAPSMKQMEMH